MWNIVEERGCLVDVMWNIVEEGGGFVEKCGCNVEQCRCYVEHVEECVCFVDVMRNIVEECGCFVDVMWNIVEESGCFVGKCGCNVDPPHFTIWLGPLPSLVSHLEMCDCGTLWRNVDVLWRNMDVMWTLHISQFDQVLSPPWSVILKYRLCM